MSYDTSLKEGLDGASTSFQVGFQELFDGVPDGPWQRFAAEWPCNARTMDLSWLGAAPELEEWLGSRTETEMRSYNFQTEVTRYQASIPIRRLDMAYTNLPVVTRRLDDFLRGQRRYMTKLAIAKMVSNPTGYDGVSLFSASHPHAGSSTGLNSNYTTSALSAATYESATQAMLEWTNEEGGSMSATPDTLIVGGKNRRIALEVAKADQRAVVVDDTGGVGGSPSAGVTTIPNVFVGEVDVIVLPELSGSYDDYWFLVDSSKALIKPIIVQMNRPVQPVVLDAMDGERRYSLDEFVYGLEGDFSFNAGAWQTCYGGIL